MVESIIKTKDIIKKPLPQWIVRLKAGYDSLQAKRRRNQEHYKILNAFLTILFPLFIVCLAELNQFVKLGEFAEFCVARPSVILFDFLMSYLMFAALLLFTNHTWIAVWIQGIGYMVISIVELFKYSTNGNHFKLADFSLVPNVKNLTSFAYIKITPPLVLYVSMLLVLLLVIYYQNPAFSASWRKRLMPAIGCTAVYVSVICIPAVSERVYGAFDVDTTESSNAFSTNEKFERNSMLAFIAETTSEKLSNILFEPENYSSELVNAAITEKASAETCAKRPNIIVIMSESFADFRRLPELSLDTDAYDAFDAACKRGYVAELAVPTFASYTVRTEFELMYGLPVRSLMDTITPQREIVPELPSSMVSHLSGIGYQTAYVHPFTGTFYGRDEIYATYGFDKMLFDEDLTVPVEEYPNGYISDKTVFDQILQLVSETDEPLYVHTTTMQNHQPYDWIENASELEVYLEGVRTTGEGLCELLDSLEALDEPTVLMFVGDHFPSMRAEGNIYDAMGIDSENCEVLYEQPALIWSNTALDTSLLPTELCSVFYMTPTVCKAAGLPLSAFYETVLAQKEKNPVYTSIFMDEADRNETLDLLTYDRVVGENYSGELREQTE
ncbi:MAG: sulfatase-like hydrolase/transferase [Oscillospiraceae bacterium]|nr:sulfatase-like hydrolase/transferase [Oscillospiraceae bacterium]